MLLALLMENHDFHSNAMRWFASNQKSGWATCPLTQLGFVRTASNARYLKPAAKLGSALELLRVTTESNAFHVFWPAQFRVSEIEPSIRSRLSGHKQLTDSYLLTVAIRNGGKLVTFDRRILQLAPDGSEERSALEILV
jgi:uncharacterized protein